MHFYAKVANMNENLIYRKIMECTDRTYMGHRKYVDRIKRKWENSELCIVKVQENCDGERDCTP
jgi:hypothetical protein